MELLSVGQRIPDRWRKLFSGEGGDGGILMFNKHNFQVAIGFPNIVEREIYAGQNAKIRVGLLPFKDVLFMIFDVGGVILVDTSFDPNKVSPEDRGLLGRKDDEGYVVTTILFDTANDKTVALRMATVTPTFSQLLEGYIEDLNNRFSCDPGFDATKSIFEAYKKYQSPEHMLKASVIIETLGIPFSTS